MKHAKMNLGRRHVLQLAAGLPLGVAAPARAGLVLPPGTSLGLASVPNLRDVGGYPAGNGTVVRRGTAYRSEKLHPVAPADLQKLAALNLAQVADLRTAAERTAKPDELPPGVPAVWLDVLADTEHSVPPNILALLADPKKANEVLGDGKLTRLAGNTYRQFVSLPSARVAYRGLFLRLGTTTPLLYHCTAGKDRTGWATAALLTRLGVKRELVYQDYLKTNDYILPEYKTYIDKFIAGGGDPDIAQAIFGARPEYLDTAFAEMNTRYGSIEGYFTEGLGIGPAGQLALRDRFLVSAS
jgi:protein-tyrosine phosphatase